MEYRRIDNIPLSTIIENFVNDIHVATEGRFIKEPMILKLQPELYEAIVSERPDSQSVAIGYERKKIILEKL